MHRRLTDRRQTDSHQWKTIKPQARAFLLSKFSAEKKQAKAGSWEGCPLPSAWQVVLIETPGLLFADRVRDRT